MSPADEPQSTILALRLDDPGDLRNSGMFGSNALIGTHKDIFTADVARFGGKKIRDLEDDPKSPPYYAHASFTNEEQALQAAVSIQQKTRKSLEGGNQARLQCAIALAHEESRAKELVDGTDAASGGPVSGGRIVCTDAVHRNILQCDIRLLYTWQKAGRHEKLMECLYDDALALLNAPFERMFSEEIRGWIGPRAQKVGRSVLHPERPHPDNDLVGLALSGGGMRSAVFSLGAVQALAHYGVLKDVDYLSTVSGGGYFGASLSALWADELPYEDLAQPTVPARLDTTPERFPFAHPGPPANGGLHSVHGNESPALKHVRSNAKLVGRGIGLFDTKTWATTGQFLASMILLWTLFLLPAATLAVLGATGLRNGFEHVDWGDILWRVLAASPAIFAVVSIILADSAWSIGDKGPWRGRLHGASVMCAGLAAFTFVPEVFGAVTLQDSMRRVWTGDWQVTLAALSPLVLIGVSAVFSLIAEGAPGRGAYVLAPVRSVLLPAAAVLTLILSLCAGVWGFDWLWNWNSSGAGGGYIAGAAGSASVAGISLSKLWDARLKDNKKVQRAASQIGLAVGGYAVLGLALIAWSWFLWSTSEAHPGWVFGGGSLAAGITVGALLYPRLSLRVLNYLSLNRTYAAMIQNTWVIGAVPAAFPVGTSGAHWTSVWPRPDITMETLRKQAAERKREDSGTPRENTEERKASPAGPYHLVCTALNLPGSTSAKLLDRQSDSFVIAPLFSGSALTRWLPTEKHQDLNPMPLAEAAAISGAAISPNMGSKTTRTLSIILTLLNVRLGRWLWNPRPSTNAPPMKVLTDSPLALYWKEMLGLASHDDGQIYLSDGGHFENLGLYELLRRRCKYIIAVSADVGALDDAFDMGNLGAALRLARVDFGVEAELGPLVPLLHDPKTGEVKSFFAAGTITYSNGRPADEIPHPEKGTLIFVKTGIIEKKLPADLLKYWKDEHPAFPYDSTTDQQYDQPQFESYRQLGYLAAREMWNSTGKGIDDTRERLRAIATAYANDANPLWNGTN